MEAKAAFLKIPTIFALPNPEPRAHKRPCKHCPSAHQPIAHPIPRPRISSRSPMRSGWITLSSARGETVGFAKATATLRGSRTLIWRQTLLGINNPND